MELMDNSLTHFLESSTQPIPYHIQVNICYDITLALSFLHSNNIIHRDLSSNNVLLRGNVLAKVTNFGMARLGDINPQATLFTNTTCPGTDVYMPPEAIQNKPVYTEKIDCFSFGVITVQILTRQFPNPGDRLQEVELNHPGIPRGKLLMQIPEIKRRENHISQIDPNNSLLPIALSCLKDEDNECPSAHQLCERIAHLKGMPKYIDSARTVLDKDEIIRSQAIHMEENECTISSKEEEIQQLRQQLQQERDGANRQLKERERQLARVNEQLEATEQVVAQFERRNAELEQQLNQREQQKTKNSSRGKELTSFKLRWREGKRAPYSMYRDVDAVVDGNTVYVEGAGMVHSYDVTSDIWSRLPTYSHVGGSMAIINGQLTTIGGYTRPSYSNELFSLIGEGNGRKWTKRFPPMPTKRRDTTAVCTGSTLIVAGGRGQDRVVLSTVEVMDTENHQWSTAADLHEPAFNASATICGDQFCMLGGVNENYSVIESVCICSVSDLLQSCVQNSLIQKFKRTFLADKASLWRQIADLPFPLSTCESFHGRLLAIGNRWEWLTKRNHSCLHV